jgi:hypothetical protein
VPIFNETLFGVKLFLRDVFLTLLKADIRANLVLDLRPIVFRPFHQLSSFARNVRRWSAPDAWPLIGVNRRQANADTENSTGYSGCHSFAESFFSCASPGAGTADITFARLAQGVASWAGYPRKDH